MRVGVSAIQGDFEKHIEALRRCGIPDLSAVEIRTPEELGTVDRLILPGGESTTNGLLMERYGLASAIRKAASEGMPVWGTCMGMILMAQEIVDRPNQFSLGILDISVQRNAFGAQVHSFEDLVTLLDPPTEVMGVFIRAPIVTRLGDTVVAIAQYEGHVVAVRQGNLLGTSFHPELTDDTRLHRWFLSI